MGEELAAFEASPEFTANVIGRAALDAEGSDPHEEMFVQVKAAALETPASAADAEQTSYCTIHADAFEEYGATQPVMALFPVADVLEWLAWFDGDDSIRVAFLGEPGAKVASELLLAGEDATVRIDCFDDPTLFDDVEFWLPDRFQNGQFLTAEGGPVPTQIETTVDQLERLVVAVDQSEGVDAYPFSVSGGVLELAIEGEAETVTATLEASVDGPGVTHRFGPGFARVVHALTGEVTLQTGPGEPLALVCEHDNATLRFVLDPV